MKTRTSAKAGFKVILLCAASSALVLNPAPAVTIYFDDGTVGLPIGSFYSSQGVTFANASWKVPAQNAYNLGTSIVDLTDNGANPPYTPTSTTPIVGIFATPQNMVSILAADVGMAGVTLNVYDAAAGGTLLASDTFVGAGFGEGVVHTLAVTAPGVMRFELYQPFPVPGDQTDGVFFDNLTFDVPEPSSLGLATLLSLMSLWFRRKRT